MDALQADMNDLKNYNTDPSPYGIPLYADPRYQPRVNYGFPPSRYGYPCTASQYDTFGYYF